jgi:hypothetical protein
MLKIGSGHAQDKTFLAQDKAGTRRKSCPEFCPENVQQEQWFSETQDKLRTALGHVGSYSVEVRSRGHTQRVSRSDPVTCPKRRLDFADLKEKEFVSVLASYSSLAELSGLANRRRVLQNASLAKWSPLQIELIKQRKFELENER